MRSARLQVLLLRAAEPVCLPFNRLRKLLVLDLGEADGVYGLFVSTTLATLELVLNLTSFAIVVLVVSRSVPSFFSNIALLCWSLHPGAKLRVKYSIEGSLSIFVPHYSRNCYNGRLMGLDGSFSLDSGSCPYTLGTRLSQPFAVART